MDHMKKSKTRVGKIRRTMTPDERKARRLEREIERLTAAKAYEAERAPIIERITDTLRRIAPRRGSVQIVSREVVLGLLEGEPVVHRDVRLEFYAMDGVWLKLLAAMADDPDINLAVTRSGMEHGFAVKFMTKHDNDFDLDEEIELI